MEPTFTPQEVQEAIRHSFERDTCSEDDLPEWSPQNASRGHCAVSALTLHDFFGGDLLCAEVHRDGVRFGYHWWNHIDGQHVDPTRDQFTEDEIVQQPWQVERPQEDHLYSAQHEIFKARVLERLKAGKITDW